MTDDQIKELAKKVLDECDEINSKPSGSFVKETRSMVVINALRQVRDETLVKFCEGEDSKLANHERVAYAKGWDAGAVEGQLRGWNRAIEKAAGACLEERPIDQDTEFLKDKGTICTNLGLKIRALKLNQ